MKSYANPQVPINTRHVVAIVSNVPVADVIVPLLVQIRAEMRCSHISVIVSLAKNTVGQLSNFMTEAIVEIANRVIVAKTHGLSAETQRMFSETLPGQRSSFGRQNSWAWDFFKMDPPTAVIRSHLYSGSAADILSRLYSPSIITVLDGNYLPDANIPLDYINKRRFRQTDLFLASSEHQLEYLNAGVGPVRSHVYGYPKLSTEWQRILKRLSPYSSNRNQAVTFLSRGPLRRKSIARTQDSNAAIVQLSECVARLHGNVKLWVKPHPTQQSGPISAIARSNAHVQLATDHPSRLAAGSFAMIVMRSTAVLDGLLAGAAVAEWKYTSPGLKRHYPGSSPFERAGVAQLHNPDEVTAWLEDVRAERFIRLQPGDLYGPPGDLSCFKLL